MTKQSTKTAGMVAQRRTDSATKRKAVLAVLEAMERTGTPITVAEVARRARVSPWLVRQQPLIKELRNAQRRMISKEPHVSAEPTAGSFRVERDLLRQENQKLRREMSSHRHRLSELLGDQLNGTDTQTQYLRLQELTSQNNALLRQAGETMQEISQLKQQLTALTGDLEAVHTVNRSLMTELNRRGNPT